jgi:hypothetical protein
MKHILEKSHIKAIDASLTFNQQNYKLKYPLQFFLRLRLCAKMNSKIKEEGMNHHPLTSIFPTMYELLSYRARVHVEVPGTGAYLRVRVRTTGRKRERRMLYSFVVYRNLVQITDTFPNSQRPPRTTL